MKTPCEVLLARHQTAEPKLDRLREHVLATLSDSADEKRSAVRRCASFCRTFFRVPRLAWGGLAAAWLLIIALHLAARDTAQKQPPALAQHQRSADTLQAVREQKRLWAELTGFDEGREAAQPRPVPRPRTERKHELSMA